MTAAQDCSSENTPQWQDIPNFSKFCSLQSRVTGKLFYLKVLTSIWLVLLLLVATALPTQRSSQTKSERCCSKLCGKKSAPHLPKNTLFGARKGGGGERCPTSFALLSLDTMTTSPPAPGGLFLWLRRLIFPTLGRICRKAVMVFAGFVCLSTH